MHTYNPLYSTERYSIMMTSSNGNIFRYWPFMWGIHWWPLNSPHKGQWCGALMFSLICYWTNSWANNGNASDSRCHHAHHDVTVMMWVISKKCLCMYHVWSSYCSRETWVNTMKPRQMDAISQMTFSNAFPWMKMFEFWLKFHWSLFLKV